MITSTFDFVQQQLVQHIARNTLALVYLVPLVYLLCNETVRFNARLPAFRGPRGLPLIGNIADIRYNAAEKYRQWARSYGDVYQIQLGNVPVIVVNSAEAARTIFGQNFYPTRLARR